MNKILSIDPGQKKCGILLADLREFVVISSQLASNKSVIQLIKNWKEIYNFDLILLGNGTTSKYWKSEFLINEISPIQLVEEANTTLRAKARYWELFPPNFLLSWLPKSLLLPPENLDEVVALILIEDYFNKKLYWPKSKKLKLRLNG